MSFDSSASHLATNSWSGTKTRVKNFFLPPVTRNCNEIIIVSLTTAATSDESLPRVFTLQWEKTFSLIRRSIFKFLMNPCLQLFKDDFFTEFFNFFHKNSRDGYAPKRKVHEKRS